MKIIVFILLGVFMWQCGMTHFERKPADAPQPTDASVSEEEEKEEIENLLSETESDLDAADMGTHVPPTPPFDNNPTENTFVFNRVMITEVVTDPQQDHGDSTANGVPFDPFPGSGTVGSTDEYVEVFNGTESTVDISAWSLSLIDGTDEFQNLIDENWETFFSLGGNPQEFGSGEFAVFGDPDGAMNNTITLQLLNETGEVADEAVIDDGNADDLANEAMVLDERGTWSQGFATPGY